VDFSAVEVVSRWFGVIAVRQAIASTDALPDFMLTSFRI